MLMLTNQAASAIRDLTTQAGVAEETGLRIASTTGDDGTPALTLSLAAQQPEDHVVNAEGAQVFLDSDAATQLDDKALDAEVSEQGEIQFMLAEQEA